MDIWTTLAEERRATADLLAGLTEEQWAAPSLCSAWTVKDVAVHLVPNTGKGLGEFVWATVRARGNLHRASESLTAKYAAAMSTAEVVAALRADAEDRFAPPGVGVHGPYTDVLVHRLDIAVPLGVEVDRPVEPWREALDFLVSSRARRGFVERGLPDLTLRATDLDWSYGGGPEVSGPAAALGLSLCGRSALLDRLSGRGRGYLATWVG
ncbi:MAG: hypothetical protein QOD98_3837 [Nocardioidaceae bacterium]|jgi:uncharacterized protein (TIGR03083 family)|nr:hypothetical protein [Nocardioidaceae bacterium]